jgi:hypothetical protein
MKFIKLFEDFRIDDIKLGQSIYATIVAGLPDNDPKVPLKVVDIDGDKIAVEFENNIYYVDLKNVEDIEK